MATNVDVLAMMDQEEKKAAERPAGTFVPTFLRLKDKQKARIRPLLNLNQCVVLGMHSKYNQASSKDSVNAVCGTEFAGECLYCEAAKNDKKLTAGTSFFLPVYVSIVEQKGENNIWTPLTYKDKDDKEVQVSGLRLLELKVFGSINQVLQAIRSLHSEDDNHDIRQYGLIIERSDINPKNPTYTTLSKGPAPMPEAAKALIPTQDAVRQLVLAACPPAGATSLDGALKVGGIPPAKKEEDDFEF